MAKSQNFFTDDSGKTVPQAEATRMERVMTDDDGKVLSRTYYVTEPKILKQDE